MFILRFSVVPRSSCTKFVQENSKLKLKITAPPVDGKANKKIIEFLSDFFSCPKSSIHLLSGDRSKHKCFSLPIPEKEGQVILNNYFRS